MKRFQSILCCVNDPDQPDPALHRAVALAKSNGAELTLAAADHSGLHFWQSESLQRAIATRRIEQLDELARRLREPGLDVSTTVLNGNPAASIIEEVTNVGHDLVLKTSRAESLATRLFFGETAIRLMRRCPCPVWILQPQHSELHRILAAVDADATDAPHVALNRQVVEMAASLAESEQCELQLAYVIPEFRDSALVPRDYREQLNDMRRDAIVETTSAVTELLTATGVKLPAKRIHQVSGVPGEALSLFAKREHVDLIVMGTITRPGLDDFVIGNTAETVLHSVECSVLAVKPAGSAVAVAG
ncbi:MAG: universal stress protein E [Porticoccaceae bacterium]|jgi:universal stress protein E